MTDSIRIIAVGDLSFNGRYHGVLDKYGPEYPLEKILRYWRNADLICGNLESPMTSRPRAHRSKCTLRAAPLALEVLRHAGFDLLSLANNHAMDFGPQGLVDTCEKLSAAGIMFAGAGERAVDAFRPAVLRRRGYSIGILSFCDVEQTSPLYATPGSPGVAAMHIPACFDRVRDLRPKVDWLIVHLHWGVEMCRLPSPLQRYWARQFVDAGADLIIGHHPHILQPIEIIGSTPVFYSLGNLCFSDFSWRGINATEEEFVCRYDLHPLTRKTCWIEVILSKTATTKAVFHPARLGSNLTLALEDTNKRHADWQQTARILQNNTYQPQYRQEYDLAQTRNKTRGCMMAFKTRIKLKLLQYGWLSDTADGI